MKNNGRGRTRTQTPALPGATQGDQGREFAGLACGLTEQAEPLAAPDCHTVTAFADLPTRDLARIVGARSGAETNVSGCCISLAILGSRVPVIYFVLEIGTGLVKVGYTAGIEKRMQLLRSERQRGDLVLLAWCGGTRADEKALHEHFARCRVDGEWFRPDAEMMEALRTQRAESLKVCTFDDPGFHLGDQWREAADAFLAGRAPDLTVRWGYFSRRIEEMPKKRAAGGFRGKARNATLTPAPGMEVANG